MKIITIMCALVLSWQLGFSTCSIGTGATYTYPVCTSANGSITMASTGGVTPYHYRWSNGDTTANAQHLVAGSYTVTISDAVGCTASRTFSLTAINKLMNLSSSGYGDTCSMARGRATVNVVSNGNAPFRYLWNNNATTSTATSLTSGAYNVVVTDSNGCTASASVTLANLGSAIVVHDTLTQPFCPGGSGKINIGIAGGTGSIYTLHWSNGSTAKVISGLAAGNYNITVTGSNSCSVSSTYSISPAPAPIAFGSNVTQPLCNGNTGSVSISPSGGTGPGYTALWNNGGNSFTQTSLSTGNYTVTVTDQNNCSALQTFSIGTGTIINPAATITRPICTSNNGGIVMSPSAGTAPYSFQWSTGDTSSRLTALAAGSYLVTVTDANSCNATATFNLSVNMRLLMITLSSLPDTCGSGKGMATARVAGSAGLAPFVYAWANGASSASLTNITQGSYPVTITDANGCQATGTDVVNNYRSVIYDSAIITLPVCLSRNGSISLTPTGGRSPYTYIWSTGDTASALGGLVAGSFTVTVTDVNQCTAIRNFALSVYNQPLTANVSITPDTCLSGKGKASASITSSGNQSPFNYKWSTSATTEGISSLISNTYQLTITDGNGCTLVKSASVSNYVSVITESVSTTSPICRSANGIIRLTPNGGTEPYNYHWSNGSTVSNPSGLIPGNYSVTITDYNTCTASRNIALYVYTTPMSAAASPVADTCNSHIGKVNVSVTGGNAPYKYSWTNGATTALVSGLGAHYYSVVVTDTNGCTVTAANSVSDIGTAISVNGSVVQPLCYGGNGSLSVSPSGGAGGSYNFLWSNGATSSSISSVPSGGYSVLVTGSHGCKAAQYFTVIQPDSIKVIMNVSGIRCDSARGGSITLSNISGVSYPLTTVWSGASGFSSTGLSISQLLAGNYSLHITDAHGCVSNSNFHVGSMGRIRLSASSLITNCKNANGSASVNVYPYSTPLTYAWSGPNGFTASTAGISRLQAGIYNVTVNEGFGCSASVSDTVKAGLPVSVTYNTTPVNCSNATGGAINGAVITGGNYPWTVLWSGPNGYSSSSVNINHLSAGNYVYQFVDAIGCVDSGSYTVNISGSLRIGASSSNASCSAANNGSASIILVLPYSTPIGYNWSGPNGFSSTNRNIGGLAPGTYNLSVTENYGCQATKSFTVGVKPSMVINYQVSDVKCDSAKGGTITLQNMTGATYPWAITWTGPNGYSSTSVDINHLNAGNYSYSVTDAHGCTASGNYTVGTRGVLKESYLVKNTSCYGAANGALSRVSVNPYSSPSFAWSGPAGYSSSQPSITGLSAGVYYVTVSEGYGCSTVGIDTVADGPYISATYTMLPTKCDSPMGGSLTNTTIIGATYPWSVSWSGPSGFSSNSVSINRLAGGTYQLNLIDALGCTNQQTFHVDSSGAVTVEYGVTPAHCAGADNGAIGYIRLSPYSHLAQYRWAGPDGFTDTAQSISNLAAGNYSLTVTEDFGCKVIRNFTIDRDFDVGVSAIKNINCPAPGMNMIIHPIAGDMSQLNGAHCAAGISGQIQLIYNGPAQYQGPTQGGRIPDFVSGDTIAWNIADFGTVRMDSSFFIKLKVDSSAVIGSQLCVTVNVTPGQGDYNTGNNTSQYCMTIIRAYDPNEKQVYPEGDIDTTQKWLTYTVNFQNTGTAAAQNVFLLDTLDANIDPVSIRIMASSFPVALTTAGPALKFNFAGINLPDSGTNQEASRGWVQYIVALKNDIIKNAVVRNTAYIYFDFNDPVVTNTTTTSLVDKINTGIALKSKQESDFAIYPNPAQSSAIITFENDAVGGKLELIDALGRKCSTQNINGNVMRLPLAQLARGLYLLNLTNPAGLTITHKLVVN